MKSYTVVSGDSLSKIALTQLGSILAWPEIARKNNIAGPDYVIFPGEVLDLDVSWNTGIAGGLAGSGSQSLPTSPSTPDTSGAASAGSSSKSLWIIGGGILLLVIIVVAIKTHQYWLKK